MKKTLAVFIITLFFVGIATLPAYAKETVLASKQGNVTKQENLPDLVHRLTKEAVEAAKKHPCVQKAFDAGRKDFNAVVRESLADGVVMVTIFTEENCD